jgi:oxygen-independent coproporphyrinogen-3 oxidase
MYEMAIDELEGAGIVQYEISNFARKGFECKHNLKYWANDPYVGIGPGAASYFGRERYSNVSDIGKYCELVENGESAKVDGHRCEGVEAACETAVLNLRRRKGICLAEFAERTGYDAMELFGDTIEKYVSEGLMEVSDEDGKRIFLSRKAIAIADGILCDFSSV